MIALNQQIIDSIQAYVRKLTSDRHLVEEVTQEVLLKMHQSLGSLRQEEKLISWLKRIVYTTLMDYHRREQKHLLEQLDHLQDPTAEEDPLSEGNESVVACIRLLISHLPQAQQQLLEAVELQGMSQAAYARQNGLSISTVKSRLQRAKQKIKNQITGNCSLSTDVYGNVVNFQKP